MKFKKYTKDDFILAIQSSRSIAKALLKLNLAPHGGNYKTAKNYIEELNIDISHMTGQSWSIGKTIGPKMSIEKYLSNEIYISSYNLKSRLINENILKYQCNRCCMTEWQNQKIPLELHHIDGNYKNNNLINLELLCPNCHALTDNYRGKNIRYISSKKQNLCTDCNKECTSTRCKSCAAKNKNKLICKRPSVEILKKDLLETNNNLSAIGRKYNVSDNAVRKWKIYYQLIN